MNLKKNGKNRPVPMNKRKLNIGRNEKKLKLTIQG